MDLSHLTQGCLVQISRLELHCDELIQFFTFISSQDALLLLQVPSQQIGSKKSPITAWNGALIGWRFVLQLVAPQMLCSRECLGWTVSDRTY
jgi:hypothetical protein